MSFYNTYRELKSLNLTEVFKETTMDDIMSVLEKRKLDHIDLARLLSPAAENCLEPMAQKANKLSLHHFGKAILLYTPMYLSNYCVNKCVYCSYNIENDVNRKQLTMDEIEAEAKSISATGLKHILILTGESKKHAPISYIVDSIKILRKYFQAISIEIYPLDEDEYREVIEAGVDGLTIYQEVYDEAIYDKVHIAGPKKDYRYRIEAPDRACRQGIRSANIGSLLGLNDWRTESFMTGMHALYLQKEYPEVELSVSLPRIRPHAGAFKDIYPVDDKHFVQVMLAFKIFLPSVGITISTRENEEFRNNLIPLGATKMSAGVTTAIGGHSLESSGESQFEISDNRSVEEMRQSILNAGYQPVFKDWMQI